MFRKTISFFSWILLWFVVSYTIKKPLILPYPKDVMGEMISLILNQEFIVGIITTLFRLFISIFICFICSIGLLFLPKIIQQWIKSFFDLIKVIPTAALIVIFIFTFSREQSIILLNIIISLPIFYSFLSLKQEVIQKEYIDPIKIYSDNQWMIFSKIIFPLSFHELIAQFQSLTQLSFKVIISSEILISINKGIGPFVVWSRFDLDMNRLFGIVGWIVVIALIIDLMYKKIIRWWLHRIYH